MGRKPNAIINHYFERGAKLNDSSNRYEHTCRSCGERFPKGRIDNLTAHLVKKCPALSTAERQKVLLDLNNLPAITNSQQQQHDLMPLESPPTGVTVGNQWTPLRTLAEFAERSEQKSPIMGYDGQGDGPASAKRPRLALQEQYTLENPPGRFEQRSQVQRKASSPNNMHPNQIAAFALSLRNGHPTETPMSSPNLAMAAAAARHVPSMIDPALDPALLSGDERAHKNNTDQISGNASMADAFLSSSLRESNSCQEGTSVDTSAYTDLERAQSRIDEHDFQTPIYQHAAINSGITEFSTEYGNGEKSARPKVRSKFSDARRKEVQEVRKQGACIRCRMLRKPCSKGSEEEPCVTCKSVESARLWKNTCRRDRVEQKLDIFVAGLHVVLATNEVNRIKAQTNFKSSSRELHAFHYQHTIPAVFRSLEAVGSLGEGGIILERYEQNATIRLLDSEHDDIPLKLEAYMKRMCYVFFEQESSQFMHGTLEMATVLSREKQDNLLTQAMEFWALIHMLIDADLDWQIGEESFVYDNTTPNNKLLRDQINAAVERRVERMAKVVLPGLERRLLKHPAHLKFETFLIGVIVFNCLEKAAWLFNCWEQVQFTATWPLEKPPHYYTAQGEDLANLMELYLHLRSIQPRTLVRAEDGMIVSEESEVARAYFEKVKLNALQVHDAQTKPLLDLNNSRSYEMRYCARLLLPAGELNGVA